jgi:cation transport ATPase
MKEDDSHKMKFVAGHKLTSNNAKKSKTKSNLRLVKGHAQDIDPPERAKNIKRSKPRTWREKRREREATIVRVQNRRFVHASVGFGLIVFLVSYFLPEYHSSSVIIALCAGSLVYIGLHLVNFVRESWMIALKLGYLILSTLLIAALLYSFIHSLWG